MDSNHRRRKSADLQSAPVGHLGNLPAEPTIQRARDSAKQLALVNPLRRTDKRYTPPSVSSHRLICAFYQLVAQFHTVRAGSETGDLQHAEIAFAGIEQPRCRSFLGNQ